MGIRTVDLSQASLLSLTVPARKDWKGPTADMTATLVDAESDDPLPGRVVRFLVDGDLGHEPAAVEAEYHPGWHRDGLRRRRLRNPQ
jgi:hypothetical protein